MPADSLATSDDEPSAPAPPAPAPASPRASAPAPVVPAGAAGGPSFRWVPVRALSARHRSKILAHLLTLGERDRYLRFGHVASDAQIARYVDRIDFDHDEVFGIFNRRLDVVAMAHLARRGVAGTAEFGVSVAAGARGRGWGARLFDRTVLHARNAGVHTLHIHALAENAAMLHIARAAGARISLEGSDVLALVSLPPQDLGSQVEALIEGQLAEWDHSLKVQAHRLQDWLELWRPPAWPPADALPERAPQAPGSRAPLPGEGPPPGPAAMPPTA